MVGRAPNQSTGAFHDLSERDILERRRRAMIQERQSFINHYMELSDFHNPRRGLVRPEQARLSDFLANRFGRHYAVDGSDMTLDPRV